MAASDATGTVRRRRARRRRHDKAAVSARLVLDDHIKTDVGILSGDLFAELFPHLRDGRGEGEQSSSLPAPLHVAIAPWTAPHSPESTNWAIVPVTPSAALAPSTIQFSPSSLALQSFALNLKQVAPSQLNTRSRSGIEILVLDVAAIELDTVFVNLDGESAQRLENGEGTFFPGHTAPADREKVPALSTPETRLTAALRTALRSLSVVHAGDLFPLPLPPHPVTHVPPNPGRIALCEPVAQGILGPNTKIIVSRGRIHSKHGRSSAPMPQSPSLGTTTEEDEDTANDQFYSAAEEGIRTDTAADETDATATETEFDERELGDGEEEEEEEDEEDEDALSDDSMDEMISLQAPMLTSTIASGIGTPSTIGRGRRTNGMSGAASVFSNFTATTARPDRPRGRLFKAQGLVQPIPPDLLHPKPAAVDDEEARVYVDTKDLTRIGCFSGDWVRVEASQEPPSAGLGAFGLGSFVEQDPDEVNWRPARVYALPEGYSSRPVARVVQGTSGPTVYLSPVTLANLENPPYLRLAPIRRAAAAKGPQPKSSAPVQPPCAREVILQHVRTPIPVERDVQTAVMAGLKYYFESRLRVVKAGDLIAVPIDTQLGRALQESTAADDDPAVEDVLGLIASGRPDRGLKYDEVAWFKVGHVQPARQEEEEANEEGDDPWGSVACVDVSVTHLEQSGSVTSRVPGTSSNAWPYYLGIKKLPRRQHGPSSPPLAEPGRQHISPLRRKVRELVAAATSRAAIHLKMPPVAILLVSTQRGIGKAFTASQACADIGLHTFAIDAPGSLRCRPFASLPARRPQSMRAFSSVARSTALKGMRLARRMVSRRDVAVTMWEEPAVSDV
ncbi:hypothetical protein VTH06DRAFT_557 [Thermothelomyces fergusii]